MESDDGQRFEIPRKASLFRIGYNERYYTAGCILFIDLGMGGWRHGPYKIPVKSLCAFMYEMLDKESERERELRSEQEALMLSATRENKFLHFKFGLDP